MTTSANQFVLVIDEAGKFGYSDADETEPGEFGIAAGALFPERDFERIAAHVASRFPSSGGTKLHITDMAPEEQQRLRQCVSDLLTAEATPLFYFAMSVHGFHLAHVETDSAIDRANAARRSPIKIAGAHRRIRERMLPELYAGVTEDAIAWCVDRFGSKYQLTVRADRTDQEMISTLKTVVFDRLKDFRETTHRVSGYDPTSKRIIHGKVTGRRFIPAEFIIPCGTGNINVDETPLSPEKALIPDTIVNWLAHSLSIRLKANPDAALNERAAAGDFPLASQVYRFVRGVPNVMDGLYARNPRKR